MDPFNTTKVISPATYLIAGIALLLAGAIIGVFADPYLPSSLSNSKKKYQAGFTAARTLVENSSIGKFFLAQVNKNTISGTVTAVQDNRISIHDGSVQDDSLNVLFGVPAISDSTIIVDANTKVVRLAENTSFVSQAKTNGYQEVQQIKPDGSTSVASSTNTYLETPASVSDISIGDSLIVIALEGAKTETEFTAQEIMIAPPVK